MSEEQDRKIRHLTFAVESLLDAVSTLVEGQRLGEKDITGDIEIQSKEASRRPVAKASATLECLSLPVVAYGVPVPLADCPVCCPEG